MGREGRAEEEEEEEELEEEVYLRSTKRVPD
jgi:hypothetical protein